MNFQQSLLQSLVSHSSESFEYADWLHICIHIYGFEILKKTIRAKTYVCICSYPDFECHNIQQDMQQGKCLSDGCHSAPVR